MLKSGFLFFSGFSPVCWYTVFHEETWGSSLTISDCSSRPGKCYFSLKARLTPLCSIRFICMCSLYCHFGSISALLSSETFWKTDIMFPHFTLFRHRDTSSLHDLDVTINSSTVSFHSLFRLGRKLLSSLLAVSHPVVQGELKLDYAQEMEDWG